MIDWKRLIKAMLTVLSVPCAACGIIGIVYLLVKFLSPIFVLLPYVIILAIAFVIGTVGLYKTLGDD